MNKNKQRSQGLIRNFILFLLLSPLTTNASIIETTLGRAVVNDASATYFNPAALTLVNNPQLVLLGSYADFRTQFKGQSTQIATGFTQTGSSTSQTSYYVPTFYAAVPLTERLTMGLGLVSNLFNRDPSDNSILRYTEASNNIRDIDLIPALGYQFNDYLSLGLGLTLSTASMNLTRTMGFPTLNVPDTQSHNEVNAFGYGAEIGLLAKLSRATLLGVNYTSAISYPFTGTSYLSGSAGLLSQNYHFTFWSPARAVLSISQFFTEKLSMIATVERIQWSILNSINIHNIAVQVGAKTAIVDANIPFYLNNTWSATLGGQYRLKPKWTARLAGSYVQSPGNPSYQLSNGNSIIAAASLGYEYSKKLLFDLGYAHAFIQKQWMNINGPINRVVGVNKGYRDAVSLKLTCNL